MTDKRIQYWHPAVAAGVVIGALLAGCTASWQAPLESRVAVPPVTPDSGYGVVAKPLLDASHYRVQPGDTLYSIAWRANLDFADLARWNHIPASYTIYPGQVLRLTAPAGQPWRPQTATATETQAPRVPIRPVPKTRPAAAQAARPSRLTRRHVDRSASRPGAVGAAGKLRWIWPVKGRVVSGYRAGDPLHKGLKIAGTPGAAVRAAESGRVVYAGSGLIGYGRLIIIKHNDMYLSAYGHNRKILVHQGQQVAQGQRIAELGRSNGGHPLLYFEIRRNGKPVDPEALLPRQ